MSSKIRADLALVSVGLATSREKAQALIMAGQVYYKEVKITKSSFAVDDVEKLVVRGHAHPFVGRGALKLDKALKTFDIDVTNLIGLDIGTATGGFTDVLLQNNAKHVYAVDVGNGQLDWKKRNDERVTVLERTNALYLTREQITTTPDITVMDVSFISVRLILPVAAMLMENKGKFAILIKPQFEAGKEFVGKKGVVRDPKVHCDVISKIALFCNTISYSMSQLDFSPITGPEGNIEYICEIIPSENCEKTVDEVRIKEVVDLAHKTLH